jgi:death-on-curing family protein
MLKLSLAEVKYVAFRLAKAMLSWDEPIPDFDSRFPGILESCLVVPFQTYSRKVFYRGLTQKAAILFYLMIKNHPFQNGNKRLAMTALFYFLYKNHRWIKVDNQELYNFAKWVAESNSKLKTETVSAIEKFLKTYLVPLV